MWSASSWKSTVKAAMHSGMMACTVLSWTGVRCTLSYSQMGKNLIVPPAHSSLPSAQAALQALHSLLDMRRLCA